MITLDTLKVEIPLEKIKNLRNDYFVTKPCSVDYDGEQLGNDVRILDNRKNNICGLKTIIIKSEKVMVECSAKILVDDYFDGININNIERIVQLLKPIMQIKVDDCKIQKCDCTANIQVDDVRSSIKALKLGRSNTSYEVNDYNTVKNNGIVFKTRNLTTRDRLIYYNKQVEMSRACNKKFISSLSNPDKFAANIKNILRIEQNTGKFRDIKKRFGTTTTDLESVLKSKENPLLNKHRQIMKFADQLTIFTNYETALSAKKFITDKGYEKIIEECNGSLKLAIDLLMSRSGEKGFAYSSLCKYIQRLKEVYSIYQIKNDNIDADIYMKELRTIERALEAI